MYLRARRNLTGLYNWQLSLRADVDRVDILGLMEGRLLIERGADLDANDRRGGRRWSWLNTAKAGALASETRGDQIAVQKSGESSISLSSNLAIFEND